MLTAFFAVIGVQLALAVLLFGTDLLDRSRVDNATLRLAATPDPPPSSPDEEGGELPQAA